MPNYPGAHYFENPFKADICQITCIFMLLHILSNYAALWLSNNGIAGFLNNLTDACTIFKELHPPGPRSDAIRFV